MVELLRPLGAQAGDWADSLVDEFGSLAAVLAAEPNALARTVGDAGAVRQLRAVRAAMLQALKTEALSGPVFSNSEVLIDYLFADMAHLPAERLRVLFLNAKNRLLRDELMGEGSISEMSIYPREIMRRALETGATALILAHNHPSGDPQPSKVDIDATWRVAEAGRPFDIRIHDHVIIARSGWSSFRALGLI
ncbi:MAG TPA: DNA repair protein RadC [Allosphingosinicella sp.]|nr:DNA repair protein RadC [Allosphingosinicella sp.]